MILVNTQMLNINSVLNCILVRFLAFVFSVAPMLAHGQWEGLRPKVEKAVAYIECVLAKNDGTNKQLITSSGFIVSPYGFILSVGHAAPKPGPNETLSCEGSLRSRSNLKYKIHVVKREEDFDLALFQLPDLGPWPFLVMGDSAMLPNDTPLYALGFPGMSDLSSAHGSLSSTFLELGRWQTTLLLNPGNSGGPVFDKSGKVVGVAAGGAAYATGKTFVIPAYQTAGLLKIVPMPGVVAVEDKPPVVKPIAKSDATKTDCSEVSFADHSKFPVQYSKIRVCK